MEELQNKIEVDKEMLSIYPQNNEKNMQKYKQKLSEVKQEYTQYKNEILQEMKNRLKLAYASEPNLEIEKVKMQKEKIEENLYLLNDYTTPFEKMGIDKSILKIRRFYRQNLEELNNEIIKILEKFEELGIKITLQDFQYNEYVKRYMKCFLEEREVLNSEKLKKEFEEIYWKCSDLFIYIRLNLQLIYTKYEKEIEKYYEQKKNEYLQIQNKTKKEILADYQFLSILYNDLLNKDKRTILNQFYDDKLNIQNYQNENIKNEYLKFIPLELLDDETKKEEINENLLKLSNSLYEYKKFLEFEFILENIKKILENSEKEKDTIKNMLNEIKSQESKIDKMEKAMQKRGIWRPSKNKKEIIEKEYDKQVLEIADKFKELTGYLIEEKIRNYVNDATTIYEAFVIANSFYQYVNESKFYQNKEEEVTNEEIEEFINRFDQFIKWPYITIINNITIQEKKSIPRVIHDIYQLLQIEIKEEDLAEDNLDSLINSLEIIKQNYYMEKAGIDKKQIEDVAKFKKITSGNV